MKKILYISGSRADYGLMKSTLITIQKHPKLRLEIVVTGMHLMPEFGLTAREVRQDWSACKAVKIHEIPATYKQDNPRAMAKFVGDLTAGLANRISQINPDIILLLGDRGEMLAGAIVGNYLSIPVAHVHGGDVSRTTDNTIRQAITKLSQIHFPVTVVAKARLIKMGEEPWRIFRINAPGLDDIQTADLTAKPPLYKKYQLDPSRPVLIVLQHPVTLEINQATRQMTATLEAINDLGHQTIVIYPNADAGGRQMIKVIRQYQKYPFIKAYQNLPRLDYLSLLNTAAAIIGNSSSGIIESGSFGLPVVNIGSRQAGRERGHNVADVNYDQNQIKRAIQKAISNKQVKRPDKHSLYIYSADISAVKIADILSKINLRQKQKILTKL